jgi:hypothetical protein
MIKHNLKEGKHTYKLPHWEKSIFINIERDFTRGLVVRWEDAEHPTKIKYIPDSAIINKV